MSADRGTDQPRGQPGRTEAKAAAARAFDRAIRLAGYSSDAVGAMLGVCRARVRKLRSDDPADLDAIPSVADLLAADHVLAEYYLAELRAERHRLHGAPPVVTREHAARKAQTAYARVVTTISEALEDERLDTRETVLVDRVLSECDVATRELRAQLPKGDR